MNKARGTCNAGTFPKKFYADSPEEMFAILRDFLDPENTSSMEPEALKNSNALNDMNNATIQSREKLKIITLFNVEQKTAGADAETLEAIITIAKANSHINEKLGEKIGATYGVPTLYDLTLDEARDLLNKIQRAI